MAAGFVLENICYCPGKDFALLNIDQSLRDKLYEMRRLHTLDKLDTFHTESKHQKIKSLLQMNFSSKNKSDLDHEMCRYRSLYLLAVNAC